MIQSGLSFRKGSWQGGNRQEGERKEAGEVVGSRGLEWGVLVQEMLRKQNCGRVVSEHCGKERRPCDLQLE